MGEGIVFLFLANSTSDECADESAAADAEILLCTSYPFGRLVRLAYANWSCMLVLVLVCRNGTWGDLHHKGLCGMVATDAWSCRLLPVRISDKCT